VERRDHEAPNPPRRGNDLILQRSRQRLISSLKEEKYLRGGYTAKRESEDLPGAVLRGIGGDSIFCIKKESR